MHVIPVIDLKGGQVVHAHAGQREQYQPIISGLTDSTSPEAVLEGLLRLFPFDTIYIADLDAISRQGNNLQIVKDILARFSDITLWLDAGTGSAAFAVELMKTSPVFGTETGKSMAELQREMSRFNDPVLSLDFHQGKLLGNADILRQTTNWPEKIIIMNLDQVGTGSGPDVSTGNLIKRHPQHHYYLAGGIRNAADLRAAEKLGAHGVLLATALHNRAISAADLSLTR